MRTFHSYCFETSYKRTSPKKMYRYLPRYGKSENKNMQSYALDLFNFGAHLSKILKYYIP